MAGGYHMAGHAHCLRSTVADRQAEEKGDEHQWPEVQKSSLPRPSGRPLPPIPSTEAEAFSSARLKLLPRFELLARNPSQVSTGTMSSRAGSQVLHPPPSRAVSGQFTSWPPNAGSFEGQRHGLQRVALARSSCQLRLHQPWGLDF
jgi:hypothetical protein